MPANHERGERIRGLWARMTRQVEEKTLNDTMGSDISKNTLDAYWLSKYKHKQFANTKLGLSALIRWIRQTKALLTVFEATGIYHRLLETCLAKHNIPFARGLIHVRRAGSAKGPVKWLKRTELTLRCWPKWAHFWNWKPANPKAKHFMTSSSWRPPGWH